MQSTTARPVGEADGIALTIEKRKCGVLRQNHCARLGGRVGQIQSLILAPNRSKCRRSYVMQAAVMITAPAAVELLARGVAVGAFLALAIAVVRSASGPARLSGPLFCLAAAAHTLTQWPGPEIMTGPVVAVIWAFSVMGAGFFWAFARDLFEDTRLDLRRFAPALVLLAIGIAGGAEGARPSFWLLHNLVGRRPGAARPLPGGDGLAASTRFSMRSML